VSGEVTEPLLDLGRIKEARAAGIEFGSHTVTHANLARIEPDRAWIEVSESRSQLEENLQTSVTTFAYPYGAVTPEVRDMVERAGYRCACGTSKGVNDPSSDRFDLKRINVRRDTTLPVFLLKLLRGLRLDR
jgi:peptidoglycan/xylan/chitin deacetylase (PgdA/CDA1 family)